MKRLRKLGLLFTSILLLGLYACNPSVATPTTIPTHAISVQPTIAPTLTFIPVTATSSFSPGRSTPTQWLPYNPNVSEEGCGVFTATVPVRGTENLSQLEISQKLFEAYLEHYKSPALGGECRLEDFKVEKTEDMFGYLAKEQKVDFVNTVEFAVQVKEVPTGWVAGNGEMATDGWIIHKFLIIGVTKANDQYVLKLIGTGP